MALTKDEIVRTLLQARTRLSACACVIVRDVHIAEDIFQNVTIKAMNDAVQFEHEAPLLSWAFLTARNEGLNILRERKSQLVVLDSTILEMLESSWCSEGVAQDGERYQAMRDCFSAMPEGSRRVLELRYIESRSCEQTANNLGIKVDALYQRLSRLHQALRNCIERKLTGEDRLSSEGA
jgi:RNA polymerase sigma-70 factor, ECF subfamily